MVRQFQSLLILTVYTCKPTVAHIYTQSSTIWELSHVLSVLRVLSLYHDMSFGLYHMAILGCFCRKSKSDASLWNRPAGVYYNSRRLDTGWGQLLLSDCVLPTMYVDSIKSDRYIMSYSNDSWFSMSCNALLCKSCLTMLWCVSGLAFLIFLICG